ncbi:response regulator transcription factor [Actinophytocola algeriensis]|uniref:Sensory transduction protein RegX3 n=1 Tax=Actinophytocola algeriensis TaxID=1768010 RepID=A0A7W7Q0C8_9PSEU|nr:response regulator transcription factor [Actinophytocola algeriensis]MBB4904655.1 DNA-binding response OmpR family regulator [Actinophytocola algeriensis]MBE1476486.1 DNA-binding response OmpR family regulator [Actinophytocola algeriensis]
MKVLVVEDDDGVADAVVGALGAHGHLTERLTRGEDALTRHHDADLVLLDLGLPDVDGLEVLRKLRRVATTPVIVLTARGDERSVVRGLHLGADDYLVKPVRLAELLARIHAVTRRAAPAGESRVVRVRDLEIDLDARRVSTDGGEIELTAKEFDILAVLARNQGVAVSRQRLLDEVWGDAYLAVSRSLDVHLTGLRAKLGRPGLVATIRGFGFRLEE